MAWDKVWGVGDGVGETFAIRGRERDTLILHFGFAEVIADPFGAEGFTAVHVVGNVTNVNPCRFVVVSEFPDQLIEGEVRARDLFPEFAVAAASAREFEIERRAGDVFGRSVPTHPEESLMLTVAGSADFAIQVFTTKARRYPEVRKTLGNGFENHDQTRAPRFDLVIRNGVHDAISMREVGALEVGAGEVGGKLHGEI